MTQQQEKYLIEAVKRLELALIGDEKFKTEGLVQQVQRHEAYIKKSERKKWYMFGALTAGGAVSPHLFNLIISLF